MRYTSRLTVPVPAADLFRWHERPGAFQRLTPPWQPVSLTSHEGIRDGDRAVIRLGTRLVGLDWVAEHGGYDDACLHGDGVCQFEDTQLSGPFGAWHHRHAMRPAAEGSILEDDIVFELPLAPLSGIAAGFGETQIERMVSETVASERVAARIDRARDFNMGTLRDRCGRPFRPATKARLLPANRQRFTRRHRFVGLYRWRVTMGHRKCCGHIRRSL